MTKEIKCWARKVSECCTVQSAEHYVSKSIFTGDYLFVEGPSFVPDGGKELPKSKLVRNCLCQKHNSALSPYDKEAQLVRECLEYMYELTDRL